MAVPRMWCGIVSLFLLAEAMGQRPIEARVMDARSREPLAFANVALALAGHGVITNEEGGLPHTGGG
ncbi:MAG: hypothetical protein KBH07_12880 [Flavobacteriales bacterium]|nr:hypothetical protein [Flavobacteriales bacterium]